MFGDPNFMLMGKQYLAFYKVYGRDYFYVWVIEAENMREAIEKFRAIGLSKIVNCYSAYIVEAKNGKWINIIEGK
jgi:hypothetical protein